jgi:hypothetical protein
MLPRAPGEDLRRGHEFQHGRGTLLRTRLQQKMRPIDVRDFGAGQMRDQRLGRGVWDDAVVARVHDERRDCDPIQRLNCVDCKYGCDAPPHHSARHACDGALRIPGRAPRGGSRSAPCKTYPAKHRIDPAAIEREPSTRVPHSPGAHRENIRRHGIRRRHPMPARRQRIIFRSRRDRAAGRAWAGEGCPSCAQW